MRYFKSFCKNEPNRMLYFIVDETCRTQNTIEELDGKRIDLYSYADGTYYTKSILWIDEEITREEFFIHCI